MRHCLFLILLCTLFSPIVTAQDDSQHVEVVQHVTIETPLGYSSRNSRVIWSPDSSLFTISFRPAGDPNSFDPSLQQMYDVVSGDLLFGFSGFLAWYADSSHILVRENPESPTFILDARTGAIAASLANAGETFDHNLIDTDIISLGAFQFGGKLGDVP